MIILVTEDNPQSLYLLEKYFTARGHTVWSATNGREGLDLLNTRKLPDVVVSDALMPLMDGFELCSSIRRDPRFHALPFVLYTATYTAESDERFALSIGVDRFVVKPVEPDRLLTIVIEVVAEVKTRPPREVVRTQLADDQLQEYTRMVLVKLEDKLLDLSKANAALSASEESVRTLNAKLVTTVARLEAEIEEHRRSDELLRMAQQAGGIGCWESNTQGAVHWTDEARTLLGYSGASNPSTLADFIRDITPDDRDRATEILGKLSETTAKALNLEVRFQKAGHPQTKHLHLRGALFPGNVGQAPRWLGIIQDISARKEAEARRQLLEQQLFRSQKMEALGNLAGGIAHDFNNILTAILGHADLLRYGFEQIPPSNPCHSSVAEITNAGQRAREIIKQILTFSRRQPIERRTLVFSKVVEDSLRLVRSTIGKNNKLLYSAATDRSASANESQIQQVLLNLCTNAAQAMAPNGGTITIALTPLDIETPQGGSRSSLKPGAYVRLAVNDTGPGMEPDVLEHIFEPFYTTKTATEGTGLGLAVVHGIVQSHEGMIGVESTPGKGTTFTLYFPAVQAITTPVNVSKNNGHPDGDGQTVLIIDDEPSVARTCAQLLEKLNYRPTAVTDPIQARDLFDRNPQAFAAVIVDFLMPRVTGLDLAKTFWTKRPDLPIILVAGFGAQMDATRARAEGFHEFLTKPFTTTTLSNALAGALKAKPAVAQ
ncbi:MAG: response regulator [Verrucomicrobia bacterium]|nr:response regulator [Verrucomicrobiota bacterium]